MHEEGKHRAVECGRDYGADWCDYRIEWDATDEYWDETGPQPHLFIGTSPVWRGRIYHRRSRVYGELRWYHDRPAEFGIGGLTWRTGNDDVLNALRGLALLEMARVASERSVAAIREWRRSQPRTGIPTEKLAEYEEQLERFVARRKGVTRVGNKRGHGFVTADEVCVAYREYVEAYEREGENDPKRKKYPSQTTLARRFNVDPRTVVNALKRDNREWQNLRAGKYWC